MRGRLLIAVLATSSCMLDYSALRGRDGAVDAPAGTDGFVDGEPDDGGFPAGDLRAADVPMDAAMDSGGATGSDGAAGGGDAMDSGGESRTDGGTPAVDAPNEPGDTPEADGPDDVPVGGSGGTDGEVATGGTTGNGGTTGAGGTGGGGGVVVDAPSAGSDGGGGTGDTGVDAPSGGSDAGGGTGDGGVDALSGGSDAGDSGVDTGICAVSIEPLNHHLGDGVGAEGTQFTKTFTVSCACPTPWLSFQIIQPNYEQPPRIYLNNVQLQSLMSFFPPIPATEGAGWQFNTPTSHDYNLPMQIHTNVSATLVTGTNTFKIVNGVTTDDYEFSDVRLECGTYTDPPGPNIVSRGAWVGTYPERSDDDPVGVQGAFHAYGDGVSCVPPANPCASGACCIFGATIVGNPLIAWGCDVGLDLKNGSTAGKLAYPGPATCFSLRFTGNSGGNPVRVGFDNLADMTGHTRPFVELPPISGITTANVCFGDVRCPTGATGCSTTGPWYALHTTVVGGNAAASYDLCLQALMPY